jgi:anti-anti-sigma factor
MLLSPNGYRNHVVHYDVTTRQVKAARPVVLSRRDDEMTCDPPRGSDGTPTAAPGELDASTAGQLTPATSDAKLEVLLDLTGVLIIDSAGIHALLAAQERAERLGVRFAVRLQDPHARQLLANAGVDVTS